MLRSEGFEVLTVRTGDEALRNAAALPVDLILLSASASQQEVGIFLETFATLPRRPAGAHPAGGGAAARLGVGGHGAVLAALPRGRADRPGAQHAGAAAAPDARSGGVRCPRDDAAATVRL